MAYPTNPLDGVRINYVVEGESGPVLLAQYGFMGYIDAWYEAGYVDRLTADVRLVLFDPRGMEASDGPHDPAAYANERMAAGVVVILNDRGAEWVHFWAYSRGGRVSFELALRHTERIELVIVGAMHPYRRDPWQFDKQVERFNMGRDRSISLHEARNGSLEPSARSNYYAMTARRSPESAGLPGEIPATAVSLPRSNCQCLSMLEIRLSGSTSRPARRLRACPAGDSSSCRDSSTEHRFGGAASSHCAAVANPYPHPDRTVTGLRGGRCDGRGGC